MAQQFVDLTRYFDERGREILANEYQLAELGLTVVKKPIGTVQMNNAVLALYDIGYELKGKEFSQRLLDFLKKEIKLSDEDIKTLQKLAVRAPNKP